MRRCSIAVLVTMLILACAVLPVSAAEEWANCGWATNANPCDGNVVPDIVTEYAEAYGTIVVVDIENQHTYCSVGGEVIADADCVSGDLYSSPTPTGLYTIWYMVRGLDMMGTYHTEYAAFFNGNIALHDADAWRDEYGGTIYQGSGSHGCINLPRWFAQIVYENSWVGTPVYVF